MGLGEAQKWANPAGTGAKARSTCKNYWVFDDLTNAKVDVNEENKSRYAKTNGFLTILQIRKSTLTRRAR